MILGEPTISTNSIVVDASRDKFASATLEAVSVSRTSLFWTRTWLEPLPEPVSVPPNVLELAPPPVPRALPEAVPFICCLVNQCDVSAPLVLDGLSPTTLTDCT